MRIPKKILVPIDFSETSKMALEKALHIARASKATVYLLYVLDGLLYERITREGVCEAIARKIQSAEEASARRRMQKCISPFVKSGKYEVIVDIKIGDPAAEILREQQEHAIDMIVIGSRKRTGLMRLLPRSTANRVMKRATCPVQVVEDEQQGKQTDEYPPLMKAA